MSGHSTILTGEQIRAARALTRIEQSVLARLSGLSLETIKRLERIHGPVDANIRTISAIIAAFEGMGVRFENNDDGDVGIMRAPQTWTAASSAGGGVPQRGGVHRLVYYSAMSPGRSETVRQILDDVYRTSQAHNASVGVTGALLASDCRFLQMLEGPKEAVLRIYGAISADPRHQDLRVLENDSAPARRFSDWSLCCGLFDSDDGLFAREPAFEGGFHPERLTPAAALGLLALVRDLQGVAPRDGRGSPSSCGILDRCKDQFCAQNRQATA